MNSILFLVISEALYVYSIIVVIDVVLSWLPEMRYRYRGFTRLLDRITEPTYRPFRRLLPPHKTGGLDLSPMLALLALAVIRRILFRVLIGMPG